MSLKNEAQHSYWQKSIPTLISQCNVLLGKNLAKVINENDVRITPEQWVYFVLLSESEGQTQQELSAKSFRSKPAVTIAMNALERANFVERRSDQQDKRINRIFLTQEGREEYQKLKPLIDKMLLTYFKGFDNSDFLQLEKNITKLVVNLSTEVELA
jgi:DNA-binding MarR family transcriptional regulator